MKVLAAIIVLLPLIGYTQLIIQPPPPMEERVIANVEDQIIGAMQEHFAPLTPTSSTILQTSAGTGIISWDELGIYGWNFMESESGLFGSLSVGGRHGLLFDGENGTVSWGDKALWFDDGLLIGRWAFEDTVITPDIEINGDIDLQGSISSYVHPYGVSTSLYDPGYDDRPTFLPGWQHGIGIGGWTENDTELAARRLYGNWNVTHSLHVERTSSAARVQTPVIELQRLGIGPPQTWSERAELTLLNGDIVMQWRDVDGDHKNIRLGQDRYAPLTHFGVEDGVATVPGDLIIQGDLQADNIQPKGYAQTFNIDHTGHPNPVPVRDGAVMFGALTGGSKITLPPPEDVDTTHRVMFAITQASGNGGQILWQGDLAAPDGNVPPLTAEDNQTDLFIWNWLPILNRWVFEARLGNIQDL